MLKELGLKLEKRPKSGGLYRTAIGIEFQLKANLSRLVMSKGLSIVVYTTGIWYSFYSFAMWPVRIWFVASGDLYV